MTTPIQFDLARATPPLPGTPVWPAEVLVGNMQNVLGGVPGSFFPQATLYVGFIVANPWLPSHAYTLGQYVTVANPNVFATSDRTVKICTTAGMTDTAGSGKGIPYLSMSV